MAIDIRNPRVQRLALIGILLSCVLYVYVFTDWMPFTYKANASELAGLEDQYRELSKDLNKARQAVDRLPYLEKEYELLHEKWEQGRVLLPEDQDMIGLLRTITVLGTNAGIDFTKFEPKAARPADGYTEIPIEITVMGGYHQIGTFLAELANMTRIVNVQQLDVITPKKRSGPYEGKPAEASFVALAYREGGVAPPAAGDVAEGSTPATKSKAKAAKPSAAKASGSRPSGGGE